MLSAKLLSLSTLLCLAAAVPHLNHQHQHLHRLQKRQGVDTEQTTSTLGQVTSYVTKTYTVLAVPRTTSTNHVLVTKTKYVHESAATPHVEVVQKAADLSGGFCGNPGINPAKVVPAPWGTWPPAGYQPGAHHSSADGEHHSAEHHSTHTHTTPDSTASPVQQTTTLSTQTPTPQTTAQPTTPTTSPSPSPSPTTSASGGGTSTPSGQTYTGDITYYAPGLGSCGITNGPTDMIVALAEDMMLPGDGANPNNNPLCGRSITISYGGKTAVATIEDTCPGCAGASLDLTPSLFEIFAPLATGRVSGVEWWFN